MFMPILPRTDYNQSAIQGTKKLGSILDPSGYLKGHDTKDDAGKVGSTLVEVGLGEKLDGL